MFTTTSAFETVSAVYLLFEYLNLPLNNGDQRCVYGVMKGSIQCIVVVLLDRALDYSWYLEHSYMNGGWGRGLSYSERPGPISLTDRGRGGVRDGRGLAGEEGVVALGSMSSASRNPGGFTWPSVKGEHTVSLNDDMSRAVFTSSWITGTC